jgi:ubiquinone/menaquinone biosynthesis C-methylase UbiE
MSNINDSDKVKTQYSTAKNLNTRGLLHQLYSVNILGWPNWVFQNYDLKPKQFILELGCGNGGNLSTNINKIPADVQIVLSDLSEGMLETSKRNLNGLNNIEYKIIDAQNICYNDNTFGVVIANHMLYHVPNRKKALREISRVKTQRHILCLYKWNKYHERIENYITQFCRL